MWRLVENPLAIKLEFQVWISTELYCDSCPLNLTYVLGITKKVSGSTIWCYTGHSFTVYRLLYELFIKVHLTDNLLHARQTPKPTVSPPLPCISDRKNIKIDNFWGIDFFKDIPSFCLFVVFRSTRECFHSFGDIYLINMNISSIWPYNLDWRVCFWI